MTSKETFSDIEWEWLSRAPLDIWLGLSAVDTMVHSLDDEYRAYENACDALVGKYTHNELVAQMMEEARSPNVAQQRRTSGTDIGVILDHLRHVTETLAKRAEPQEGREPREFLFKFGKHIAAATGESLVNEAAKTSQAEADFLYEVRKALDLLD